MYWGDWPKAAEVVAALGGGEADELPHGGVVLLGGEVGAVKGEHGSAAVAGAGDAFEEVVGAERGFVVLRDLDLAKAVEALDGVVGAMEVLAGVGSAGDGAAGGGGVDEAVEAVAADLDDESVFIAGGVDVGDEVEAHC